MNNDVLVLHRRIRTPDMASLHCRELELRLDADGRHLVFSRYTELYCEDQSIWGATRDHKVPLVSLLRWVISQGSRPDIAMVDKKSVVQPSSC
ncbi:hypothetical protein K5Q02_16490 [Pseudomonas sp. MM211]|uniref:hypothetical protein n=1 Tax=Pseudomonas sp. MM211 TaxID=2866808 RepID=UPI001CEDE74D|nr:hypothetical protein [Pseudomonas sp. MM211]UCJ15446.1 hypothetical protein K5Q02_16490 [Pseudomonas sp. MM211]